MLYDSGNMEASGEKDIRHNSQKNMYKNSMITKNKLVGKIVLK